MTSLRWHGLDVSGRHLRPAAGGPADTLLAAARDEGAAVVACGRRFEPGPIVRPGLGEISRAHLDVTDEAEVEARFAELAELDIVVCSAGVGGGNDAIRTVKSNIAFVCWSRSLT